MENEDILMRNQQLILENEALRLHIEDLKNGFEGSCMACEPVGEMNKKLRAERDEARREICMNATNEPYRQMCGSGILLPQDAARERGWDCFKDYK
jgi:hypothetical protein